MPKEYALLNQIAYFRGGNKTYLIMTTISFLDEMLGMLEINVVPAIPAGYHYATFEEDEHGQTYHIYANKSNDIFVALIPNF